MTRWEVALNGDTSGTIDSDMLGGQSAYDLIGKRVRARSQDENGNLTEVEGILTDVLSEETF